MSVPIEPGKVAVTIRPTYSLPRGDNDAVEEGAWFWVGKYISVEESPYGIATYYGYNFMGYPFNEVWIPAEDVAPMPKKEQE